MSEDPPFWTVGIQAGLKEAVSSTGGKVEFQGRDERNDLRGAIMSDDDPRATGLIVFKGGISLFRVELLIRPPIHAFQATVDVNAERASNKEEVKRAAEQRDRMVSEVTKKMVRQIWQVVVVPRDHSMEIRIDLG